MGSIAKRKKRREKRNKAKKEKRRGNKATYTLIKIAKREGVVSLETRPCCSHMLILRIAILIETVVA